MTHDALLIALADTISAFAVVGTLLGYLPDIAALAAIVWYMAQLIEFYERRRSKSVDDEES